MIVLTNFENLLKMNRNTGNNVLRWIAVPFASIIGATVCYFLVSLWISVNNQGYSFYTGLNVTKVTDYILILFSQGILGAGFVLCGSYMAPSSKRICSVVLSTILCCLEIIILVFSIITEGFSFWELMRIFATIIGSIMACVYVFDKFDD